MQDAYAAFSRNDIPTLMTYVADDIVWARRLRHGVARAHAVRRAGGGRWRTSVRVFANRLPSTCISRNSEPREFLAAADKVVVLGHYNATTPAVVKKLQVDFAMVFTLRHGKVIRFQGFCNSAAINEA